MSWFSAAPKLGTGASRGNVVCPCVKKLLEAKSWLWKFYCVALLWFQMSAVRRPGGSRPRWSFNGATGNFAVRRGVSLPLTPVWDCCSVNSCISLCFFVFVFFVGMYTLLGNIHRHRNSWDLYHIIINKLLYTFWLLFGMCLHIKWELSEARGGGCGFQQQAGTRL